MVLRIAFDGFSASGKSLGAKLISRNSHVQVVIIENQNDLRKFFVKNLIDNEIVVCMGAGSISKWLREMDL